MLFCEIAHAANINTTINNIMTNLVNPLIQGIFAIAFFLFIWGVVEMVFKADSPDGRETGKRHIIWSLVGFVIMVGVWGIISIIKSIVLA